MKSTFAIVALVLALWNDVYVLPSLSAELPKLTTHRIPDEAFVGSGEESLFDYLAIVRNDNPSQAALYEECALAGDAICSASWGTILAERLHIGMETNYNETAVIYLLRNGLCNPDSIEDNTKDGLKLTCAVSFSLSARYISEAYRRGAFGLPQNTQLADCWSHVQLRDMTCETREIELYGQSILGKKPENKSLR